MDSNEQQARCYDPKIRFRIELRDLVANVLNEANLQEKSNERYHLFLEKHWMFFDSGVQKVLMERHWEKSAWLKESPNYAVEAYLIAEQYAWLAYGDDILKDTSGLDEEAGFFFVKDMCWFARLMVAVAKAVEKIPEDPNHEKASLKDRIQSWRNLRNHWSNRNSQPNQWLEGTNTGNLAKFKQGEKQDGTPTQSIRVTASTIRSDRKEIFAKWRSSWKVELDYLERMLKF